MKKQELHKALKAAKMNNADVRALACSLTIFENVVALSKTGQKFAGMRGGRLCKFDASAVVRVEEVPRD